MKVLIIGGTRPGHERLKKLGCELVAIMSVSDAFISDVTFGYFSLHYLPDDAVSSDYVDLAKMLSHKSTFESVCSFNDKCLPMVVDICRALGIDAPISPDAVELTTNKFKMREHLSKHGIDDVRCKQVSSGNAAISFLAENPGTYILKPLDGTASKDIMKISNSNEIDDYFSRVPPGEYLLEEFIDGREFSVEAFSEGGKHKVIDITEKFKNEINFVEIGHLMPARVSNSERLLFESYVIDVLSALGIENGPTHTEVILSGNIVRIVETHARIGGDRINRLIENIYGIDVFELTAKQVIGELVWDELVDIKPSTVSSAVWFNCMSVRPSLRISNIANQDKAKSMEGVTYFHVQKAVGDIIGEFSDSYSRIALAVSKSESAEDALRRAKLAVNSLDISVSGIQSS